MNLILKRPLLNVPSLPSLFCDNNEKQKVTCKDQVDFKILPLPSHSKCVQIVTILLNSIDIKVKKEL